MATATERKFTSLRKRLDQLGYRQPLGVESLPLVEKLFGDLLHTTESLKGAKQQLGTQQEQKSVWDKQVEPYRADNARLVQENAKLHQQLLHLKEKSESRVRDIKLAVRRIGHENTDLKFLNTQYLNKMTALEKESQGKSEKLLSLQQKSCEAVIQTPGGRRRQIPLRKQRMQIDSLLPENSQAVKPPQPKRIPTPDPYVADLLQVADRRIAELQGQVDTKEQEKENLTSALHDLRKQVESREAEIERLAHLLKGGRPPEALASDSARDSSERMVAHLNIQVDFLQQANEELELKLKEKEAANKGLRGRVQDLSGKNSKICTELQQIGGLVKEMETEREGGEERLGKRVADLEARGEEMAVEIGQLETQKKELVRLQEELTTDNKQLAGMLAAMEGDTVEAAAMLERLNKERRELRRQCTQLRESESSLLMKVSELERSNRGDPGQAPLVTELRRLRMERDELKEATTSLETELAQIQSDVKSLASDRDNFQLLYQQAQDTLNQHRLHSRSATGSAAMIRRLEAERDDTRMELQQVRREVQGLRDRLRTVEATHQQDVGGLEDQQAELQLQLDETIQERDELLTQVSAQRNAIHSLETELTTSSDALTAAYSESTGLRSRVAQLQSSVDAGQTGREHVEMERRKEVRMLGEVQSSLSQSAGRIAQLQQQLEEKEVRVVELMETFSALDREHDLLRVQADQKDETVEQLQQQLTEKESSVTKLNSVVARLNSDLFHQQSQHTSRGRELTSLSSQLETVRTQLNHLQNERETISAEKTQLSEELGLITRENQAVHDELRRALRQKESYERKAEEYGREILRCQEAMASKEHETAELLQSQRALSEELGGARDSEQGMLSEVAASRAELATLVQMKHHLEEVAEQQASEIQQHLQSLAGLEQQLSNVTHSLARMEATLRQEGEEKKALVADLTATRELCLQLDKTKESMTRQLASLSITFEQQQTQMDDLKSERSLLKKQLASERSTNENLQLLLSGERRKEFHAQHSGQEKELEIQHFRRQLARMEEDRLSQNEQLQALHSEHALLTEELKRVKMELSAEKFHKEQMAQQLKATGTFSKSVGSSPAFVPGKPAKPDELVTAPTTTTSSIPNTAVQPLPTQERELFIKERESLASESEKVVIQLMGHPHFLPSSSPPHSSPHTTHTPPSHSVQSRY